MSVCPSFHPSFRMEKLGSHCSDFHEIFLILNFRRVLNVLCFLLGNSPASEFICRRFGTLCLFHLHRRIGVEWLCLINVGSGYFRVKPFPVWIPQHFLNIIVILHLSVYEDGTERFETSAYKFQTPGNYPEKAYNIHEIWYSSIFRKSVETFLDEL